MRGPLADRTAVLGPAIVSFPIVGAARIDDERLAVVSRNLAPARVAVLAPFVATPAKTVEVPTGDGAWGVTADGRGGVWLGMFGARGRANLYRLDLGTLRVAAAAAIDAVHLWDLAAADDGMVYGVSDGPAKVFAYDPATRRARDLGVLGATERPRSIAVVGRTLVVGGRDDRGALLRAFDLDRRTQRSVLPDALADHQTVYSLDAAGGVLAVGTRGPGERNPSITLLDGADLEQAPLQTAVATGESVVDGLRVEPAATWATVRPSGALLRLERGSAAAERAAQPVPLAEQRGVFRLGDDLVGASGDGSLWRYRPATGEVAVEDLLEQGRVAGGPEIVQSLAAGGGRVWAGGTFGLARRDGDGRLTRTAVPGEPKALALVDGTLHLALYPIGEVWVAPDGAPPHRRTALPREENRPLALHHAAGLGLLLVGTAADRTGGGGFHVLDIASGRLRSWRDPLGTQPVQRLAAVDDLALLGGREGTVVAWDLPGGAEAWRIDRPVPGGGGVAGIAALDQRLHVFTSGGWHLVVDLAAREVVQRRQIGQDGGGLVTLDGAVYGVDADRLLRFPADGAAPAVLLEGLAPRHWGTPTLAADGLALHLLRGRDVVRVEPPPP